MSMDNNNGLNSEVTALKNQVFALLVAMVVVTGSLTVYLYRQDSILGKQCAQISTAMNQTKSSINMFVYQLMVYGQKHPEFAPVLKKYGLTAGTNLPPPSAPGK